MAKKVCKTYCRICEALCGLEVQIEGAKESIINIKPDKAHPVSEGYACIKGTSFGGVHHDKDRINVPLKKVNGQFIEITWQQALAEIGAKIKATTKRYGARSLGMYTGNPTYFNFKNVLFSQDFLKSFGSPNLFASHSVDANNKFFVATKMYGRSMVHPVPDFEHMQFFMCLGSNPQASQMSFIQQPNAVKVIGDIEARGGRVIIVDPRRTETAQKVGEYCFIKPGTDAYLLLAMLYCMVHELGIELEDVAHSLTGIDAIIEACAEWQPERVEAITGIAADSIRDFSQAYLAADGAALYLSTGVNMGAFGSICYWLVQVINLITGNVDRQGGLLVPTGPFNVLKLAQALGVGGDEPETTLIHGWPKVAGCFPVSALAEEIDNEYDERIRMLLVSAGNPLHSVPGNELVDAFKKLDLLVAIDIYPNETSQLADYILPATDMLERSDYPISWTVLQPKPHAQYTEAVVKPKYERREEWAIFADLMVAGGARKTALTLGNIIARTNLLLARLGLQRRLRPEHLLDLLLRWGGQVNLAQLRQQPSGVMLRKNQPHSFLNQRVPTATGLVNLAPIELLNDLQRLVRYEKKISYRRKDCLLLIGRRERKTHNTWLHNNPNIKHAASNVALINPADAKDRNIIDGGMISIDNTSVSVQIRVKLSKDIGRGVISIPHGWGHRLQALSKASSLVGVDVNQLIPTGNDFMEPLSGQAIMMAHPVIVQAVSVSVERQTTEPASRDLQPDI